jgi:hypothetical protein
MGLLSARGGKVGQSNANAKAAIEAYHGIGAIDVLNGAALRRPAIARIGLAEDGNVLAGLEGHWLGTLLLVCVVAGPR